MTGATPDNDGPAGDALERHGEPSAATELLFDLGGEAVGLVEKTHLAISERAFTHSLGGRGPVKAIHDGVSRLTYGSLRGVAKIGALAGGAIAEAAAGGPERRRALSESRAGALALAAVNGWSGDKLEQRGDPLRIPMSLRKDRKLVPADRESLAEAYPDASGRLVVFLHGLMESEDVWWLGTKPAGADGAPRPNYGERMQADLGYTPLYVRYNSGLRVSENGRRLAKLLDRVVAAWPLEVSEIVLFGHSMGGLVARSANHHAAVEAATAGAGDGGYVNHVRHVIYSGSPHHGSPLEKFANGGAKLLNLLPETRGFGDLVNSRSAGVKDMRYGNVLDADWEGHDPDELWTDRRGEAPLLESATHYFIGATLTKSPETALSRIVGDLLVVLPSAWAEGMHKGPDGSRLRFEIERSRNYGGITHFHLTSHPEIYAQIKEWLTPKALAAST